MPPVRNCIALALIMAACDDPTDAGGRGIHVSSGATLADTVVSTHVLSVAVRGYGVPARGVEIRFAVQPVPDPDFPGYPAYLLDVAPVGVLQHRIVLTDSTDVDGTVSVVAYLGFRAGATDLVITVPALEFVDTVRVTIRPGAPVGVVVSPSDTAVYAGQAYTLRAHSVDRFANPRTEPVEFTSAFGPVNANGVTGSVVGTAIGRGAVIAQAQGLPDTAYVSVIPPGWVATEKFNPGNGGPEGIFLTQLDGSGRDSLTSGLINSFGTHGFAWSRDGQQRILPRDSTLFLLQPGGTEQPLVTMTGLLNTAARFSVDGQWVYFALAYGSATQRAGLYRVRSDGTGLERLGDDSLQFGNDYFAAPSHDGQSVAYSSTRSPCGVDTCIRVLDLATNQDRVYGTQDYLVRGSFAAWSPVEDIIAYNHGFTLSLISSDGSPLRVLASNAGYVKWMDWSPDGEWLIVADNFGVELFGVHNGHRLPIAQFLSYSATTWRP